MDGSRDGPLTLKKRNAGILFHKFYGVFKARIKAKFVKIQFYNHKGPLRVAEVEIFDDASNSVALATADRSDLVAGTRRKFGMRFDGRSTIEVFVDGIRIQTLDVDSTIFPVNVNFGFVFAIKTGTAHRRSVAIDWIRVAYEELR